MSSGESTETLIRNPKDSAVIFGSVVVLAVLLEFMFSYFRNHRSSYVGGLFAQLSEETMIVGCISLLFVFVVQSFPNLPDSWVTIVRWAQGVIFFMIVFFVVGAAWTALITRIVCVMVQKFEFRLLEALTRRQNTEICDMLRSEWRIGGSEEQSHDDGDSGAMHELLMQSQSADRTVEDDLRQLLKNRVGDLGRLRQEFGATKEITLDRKPTSPEDKNRARLVEQFLGDAALRLQDYFLEGSQFTAGGLRDPEPESTLQSTLLVLRRVFMHQIRTKRYLPQPLQALLLTTEKLRLSSYILSLEAQRRELLSEWRTRRLTSHDSKSRDGVLTYEDLIADRRRKARDAAQRRDRSASSFVGDEETLLNESRIAQQDPTESLKEGAQVLATHYVGQRAQSWLVDGCLDPEVICRYVPFSKYLYKRMRTGVVGFVDITWQCWVSLVVVSSINSARLYVLPGKLQSKPVLETEDYRSEMFSFIFVIGYPPMVACIVTFVMLMRNFRWYLRSVKELRLNSESAHAGESEAQLHSRASSVMVSPGGDSPNHVAARMQRRALENTGKKAVSASVWLPPEQLAGQLSGDLYEDPSRYLIRGNKSFTLHTLKIPVLLTHFYFSMFVVKLWNTGGLGAEIVGYVALGVIPVLVVFSLLPVALFAVTCLMSLGLRIDHSLVCFTAARQCRRVAGKQAKTGPSDARSDVEDENKDGGSDKNDDDEELATLVAPLVVANARKRGDVTIDAESEADIDLASRNLVRRVLGFLPAADNLASPTPRPNDSLRNVSFLEASTNLGDETTTVMSAVTKVTQAESLVGSAAGAGHQDALVAQLRHRVRTLEELLSSSTGLEMPTTEDVGTPLRSPNSMRKINSMRRKRAQLGSHGGSLLDAPLLPDEATLSVESDGADTMRVLVEYYKKLLIEQAALVKRQRERIQRLEETHRGGVFHPEFYRRDSALMPREGALPASSQHPSSRPAADPTHLEATNVGDAVLAARRLQESTTLPATVRPPVGAGASNILSRRMLDPVRKAIDGSQGSPQK